MFVSYGGIGVSKNYPITNLNYLSKCEEKYNYIGYTYSGGLGILDQIYTANTTQTSNTEYITALSGIKGYQYYISTEETCNLATLAKQTIVTKEQLPTFISGEENLVQYLYIRAIDNAGNASNVTKVKLEIPKMIKLRSNYETGMNYVPLSWKTNDNETGYTYRLFEKSELTGEFRQVSTNYNKQVKVLNVYPTGSDESGNVAANTSITFKSEIDGQTYTLPKSASLKMWMESASEEPLGYGKGLIKVDAVAIDEYNNNPNAYLKDSNGNYKYDVIMFGSWDDNGFQDLSAVSLDATRRFIDSGRGALFGHDVIWPYENKNNFGQLADRVNMKLSKDIPWIGSSVVKTVKRGYLTKYPYNIEEGNLTVPASHSTGEYAYGDIWLRYEKPFLSFASGPEQGENANNNYYLTTWNNCAVIRTGHSNGEATPDEQRVLANTLWYLGQVTEDTSADAYTAEDLAAPEINDIKIDEINHKLNINAEDKGTTYEHYVVGTKEGDTELTTLEKFLTPGTYTWKVPEGIKKIKVTIAGAGGGGGSSRYGRVSVTTTAGAGGNGDKQEITIDVKAGEEYPIVVGKGGKAGSTWNYWSTINPTSGEASSFGETIVNGGECGANNLNNSGSAPSGANAGNGQGGKGGVANNTGYEINEPKSIGEDGYVIIESATLVSNTVKTTVTTGLEGYSWIIDNKSNTDPDTTLEELPTTIPVADVNCGKWIHVKAVDKAGNWSIVKHIELKIPIALTIDAEYVVSENKIPVTWDVDFDNGKYTYKLYQSIDSGAETIVSTTKNKSYIITNADKAAPSKPIVTAKKRADDTGNDLTITESEDNGSVYTNRVETTAGGTTYKSRTVETTATSGIKGYQYAITTSVTYQLPAPNSTNVVALDSIPTFVSGEENGIQYLYIRAVDNGGNVSETERVLLQVPIKITLSSKYEDGMNYVPLSWKINDKRPGYDYKLFRNNIDVTRDTNNYVREIISSENKSLSYSTVGTYEWEVPDGVESLTITAAGAGGGGSGSWTGKEDVGADGTKTASFTTAGTYTWEVPAGVTSITVTAAGAGGGGSGNYEGTTSETKTVSFTDVGNHTWTVPKGVTSINVEIAGAGGGGGVISENCHDVYYPGDGNVDRGNFGDEGPYGYNYPTGAYLLYDYLIAGQGGNGNKKEVTLNVTPGQKYDVVVGKGGNAGYVSKQSTYIDQESGWSTYYVAETGTDGEASSFGTNVAKAGKAAPVFTVSPNGAGVYFGFGQNGASEGNGQGGKGGFGQGYYQYGGSASNHDVSFISRASRPGQNGYVKITYTQATIKPGTSGGKGGLTTKTYSVTPGEKIQLTVGKGGIAGVKNGKGGTGGNTTIKDLTVQGGTGGIAPTATSNGKAGTSYGNGGAGGVARKSRLKWFYKNFICCV